ncbi:hypothetical protein IE53DRAFT_390136 [Violaceomyces palustris]|uniref:Uncharacterized protein n=1 Tax=Violaceomyces palustris TaxID=1673888 RepID=A0ACD0NPI7_9BASI|nr:hypothetical protein IE53DRAFT_390136 [Violaceomyces palustris]
MTENPFPPFPSLSQPSIFSSKDPTSEMIPFQPRYPPTRQELHDRNLSLTSLLSRISFGIPPSSNQRRSPKGSDDQGTPPPSISKAQVERSSQTDSSIKHRGSYAREKGSSLRSSSPSQPEVDSKTGWIPTHPERDPVSASPHLVLHLQVLQSKARDDARERIHILEQCMTHPRTIPFSLPPPRTPAQEREGWI